MSDSTEQANQTLYVKGSLRDGNYIHISAATLLALFTLECSQAVPTLVFVEEPCECSKTQDCKLLCLKPCDHLLFRIKSSMLKLDYKFRLLSDCPIMIKNCSFPAVCKEFENYCIVGLCSSLRHILSCNNSSTNDLGNRLLGFRKSCLQACAEVSIWTKFCEIDSVEVLAEYYNKNNPCSYNSFPALSLENVAVLEIPTNIIRFERHLEHPPILHNALKHKQESLQKTHSQDQYLELKKKKLAELPNLEHKFAEGLDLTLADLLLYPTISLLLHKLSNRIDLKKTCPLVFKWHDFMDNMKCIANGKSLLTCIKEDCSPISPNIVSGFTVPNVANESLYKSDPQRYKPRWRSFTRQEDIEAILQKLNKLNIVLKTLSCGKINCNDKSSNVLDALKDLSVSSLNLIHSQLHFNTVFEWDSFPPAVHPAEGQLPKGRVKCKLEQLESIAQIIIDIAKSNSVIVDFCSGGGHLGILLAYCLPSCKLLFVENKKNSLDKARCRVKALNLKNVYFYQCNLDYFDAAFDIGVSLHACGTATDLVMLKCIRKKASFVCCPCCYGSIKPNHILNYPRSSLFSQEFNITLSEFLILGHAADQTHTTENPKTIQGKKCMQLVDFDRLSYAKAHGYETTLTTMNPPDCSPKNHILIGIVNHK